MDYELRLNKLKTDIDRAKSIKIRSEARLEQLEQQQGELLKELELLNIKPEELGEEIKKLNEEIETLFVKAESLLPRDIMDRIKNE